MNENASETGRQQIDECRKAVNAAADEATGRRPCPNCDMDCFIHFGRVSQMFFFKHAKENDCIYNQIGTSKFFKKREDALKAEVIFWEPDHNARE